MKENYFKFIFFTTIIILLIISIFLAVKNKNSYASEDTQLKKETIIDKTINIGVTKYDTLNPILTKNQDIQYITKLIYKPIIDISEDFNLQKGLAEEWNKIDDKTYLIKLQEDIKWDDGKNFTSEDIEYTIDFIKTNQSIYNENINNIEKLEIVNDYIIKVFLKEPEEDFEYMLCFPIICENENIGTGNYKIESINEQELLRSMIILQNSIMHFLKKKLIYLLQIILITKIILEKSAI